MEIELVFSATLSGSFECIFNVKILLVQFKQLSLVWKLVQHLIPLITVDLQLFLTSLIVDIIPRKTTMDKKCIVVCFAIEAEMIAQGEFIRGFTIDYELAGATLG